MLGDGLGRWQLTISSALELRVMSLVRTPDGFLTNLSGSVAIGDEPGHIYFFNPASNSNQLSMLRIVNDSGQAATVTISGTDDDGNVAPGGSVTMEVPPNSARLLSSSDLEEGNSDSGLVGALGDGIGKWHLLLQSNVEIRVQSLLNTSSGFLTNLE